jgi:hypothetical protein
MRVDTLNGMDTGYMVMKVEVSGLLVSQVAVNAELDSSQPQNIIERHMEKTFITMTSYLNSPRLDSTLQNG